MTLRSRASDLLAEVERYENTKGVLPESVMVEWGRRLVHDLAAVLRESVQTEEAWIADAAIRALGESPSGAS